MPDYNPAGTDWDSFDRDKFWVQLITGQREGRENSFFHKVSVSAHRDNFGLVRDHGSKLDQCLSALIEDLDARGMLDDVTVIAWGEFGRTPRINSDAGRDHWPG